MGFFALLEHCIVVGNPRRTSVAKDFAKFVGVESSEQRQLGNQ
jgi:hypothetical protein